MSGLEIFPLIARFVVPGIFSILFRIFGLGARSKKAAIFGMAFYLGVSLLVPAVMIPTLGYDVYKQFAFVSTLLANLAIFIISSDGFLKTCFMHFSQANVIFWIATTLSAVRRLFGFSYLWLIVLMVVVCSIIYYIALRYWAKPMRFMADTVNSGWLRLLAVPGCAVLAGVAISLWVGLQPNYNELYLIGVVTLMEVAFVAYMYGLYSTLNQITVLAKEKTRKKLLESEIIAYQESLTAAKQMRHDLRHHDALILDYLQSGNVSGAVDYLRANQSALSEIRLMGFSVNPIVNAVLRIYSRQAQTVGVTFAVNAQIPETLPMAAPELGALLSNMLENALEACVKVDPAKRQIAFNAITEENGLRLELRNSVSGTVHFEDGNPVSTKTGGGTGTKSMAHIVEKYCGMLRFKQEENIFVTQIMLPDHK